MIFLYTVVCGMMRKLILFEEHSANGLYSVIIYIYIVILEEAVALGTKINLKKNKKTSENLETWKTELQLWHVIKIFR